MASEIPLVLQSCEFEGLRFICSSGTWGLLVLLFDTYAARAGILYAGLALHDQLLEDYLFYLYIYATTAGLFYANSAPVNTFCVILVHVQACYCSLAT